MESVSTSGVCHGADVWTRNEDGHSSMNMVMYSRMIVCEEEVMQLDVESMP